MTRLVPLAVLLASSPALASEPAALHATLATPLPAARQINEMLRRWSCVSDACVGRIGDARLGDSRACRELVEIVGPVTTFTAVNGNLSATELDRCNRSAGTPG